MSPEEQLRGQQRAATNHADWFAKLGTRGQLLFPELEPPQVSAAIERVVAEARAHEAEASCWSLVPTQPADLGAFLLARGFQWGWQPHWMRLELANWDDGIGRPDGIVIERATERHVFPEELPNYSASEAAIVRGLPDDEAVHLVALDAGEVVGHVVANRCWDNNSAGVYSCGVVEGRRRRGIGAALTATACHIAREWGCEDVLLNATAMGEPVYGRVGFVSCGLGQTWWLHREAMAAPPTAHEVHFVECVGRGLVEGLEAPPEMDLDAQLPCMATAMEVAVLCKQPNSVEWLVEHGATLDVVSCWDMGWRERAQAVLSVTPALANLKRGELGLTPLHVAVDRGDGELAELVLSAKPDLAIKDDVYQATALGWAEYQANEPMRQLIAAARRGASPALPPRLS